MSRIRSIKPQFFSSELIASLPDEVQLFFIGVWTEADDGGRLLDLPKTIAGALYPHREDRDAVWVEMRLRVLASVGLIVRYAVEGRRYIEVRNFRKHQRQEKTSPSRLPAPPGVFGGIPAEPDEIPAASGESSSLVLGTRILVLGTGEREERPPAPAIRGPRPRSRGVFGLEEQARKPKTPAELHQRHRELFRERFPAYDGVGGRLSALEKCEALYAAYSERFDATGEQDADARFKQWLSDDHAKVSLARERAGGAPATPTGPTGPAPQMDPAFWGDT